MKKKFVDVRTGKEVAVGVPYDIEFVGPHGAMKLRGDHMSAAILDFLKACGAVKEVIDNEPEKEGYNLVGGVPDNIGYYIAKMGNRLGIDPLHACMLMEVIGTANHTAPFSILLREVALELDRKYPDHIENSREIYYINLFNGTITKADKGWIRNYRNFAAFRTMEDAKVACKILSPIMKDLFKKV